MIVAGYIELLGRPIEKQGRGYSKPSVKQHLAAIRMLFDYLVTGGVLPMNPASSIRGPKYSIKRGKTSVLTAAEARELLDSIETDTIIGLRDRALIGVMVQLLTSYGSRFDTGRRLFPSWKALEVSIHGKRRQVQ